jgi:glycine amidinotransferase
MNKVRTKTIVNSWNEWDPLKHVIVGRADGGMIQAPEPGMVFGKPGEGFEAGEWGPFPDWLIEIAKEQLDNFAGLMEERGIRVDRPALLDFSQKVETPDWVQESMVGCMPPRDTHLCVGNEILEATMSVRSRWYEYLCLRPLLEQYFKEDPNFLWEAAPKPRLKDDSFEKDYWHNYYYVWAEEEKKKRMHNQQWHLTEKEPLFDAADFLRFGKDLFVQRSAVNNSLGIDWLRRHFEGRGFRLHEISFGGSNKPWHIDCTVVAPREGMIIQNPTWMPITPEFHELFKINGWEVVMAAPPTRPEQHEYSVCSIYLAYNCFSIDPKTICVEKGEVQFMDQLDEIGFEVIPVEFFEVSPFGGGLHCSTLDIYREGECEDYFPKQIPGF